MHARDLVSSTWQNDAEVLVGSMDGKIYGVTLKDETRCVLSCAPDSSPPKIFLPYSMSDALSHHCIRRQSHSPSRCGNASLLNPQF